VCIDDEPAEVATRLRRFVRRRWDRRLGRIPNITRIHHRADATCPIWLNLDWNTNHPGGPYGHERWAVGIEPDGATETLAPATGE
jgi:CRISPR/Cas system Type II protein with McrA/HNH and RuvC-like nuclease domain